MRIRMVCNVRPDLPFLCKSGTILRIGKEYDAITNQNEAVTAICESGEKLGVKPNEFVIVEETEQALREEKMKTHELKLDINFCDDVLSGRKNFEIRYNDRGYQTGDHIRFTPVDEDDIEEYHKVWQKEYEITYVLAGWGLKDNYVVFGIKEVKDEQKNFV